MRETVVKTDGLTKLYGKDRGVLDLDLTVVRGEVYGYLGPNGAGKTTTIRILLDLIRATTGSALIFGLDSTKESVKIRRRIGYLPGELVLYATMTGKDFLDYFSELRGGTDANDRRDLVQRLGLDLKRPIHALSHGNKQKLGLVQAFMNKPELIILDEPTTGLDPLVQQEFHTMLAEVRRDGRTVFLSSHVLPEVERVCDRIGVLRDGRLATVQDMRNLMARAVREVEIQFGESPDWGVFRDIPGVTDLVTNGKVMHCKVKGPLDALVKAASRFRVVDLVSREPSLEEAFLDYYETRKRDVKGGVGAGSSGGVLVGK